MDKIPHCMTCKTTKNLLPTPRKHKNKAGIVKWQTNVCRSCNASKVKRYRQTEQGKKKTQETALRMQSKWRDKINARSLLNYHLGVGNIEKPLQCSGCKKARALEGHHSNYSKPLEVFWLCRQCHADIHQTMVK